MKNKENNQNLKKCSCCCCCRCNQNQRTESEIINSLFEKIESLVKENSELKQSIHKQKFHSQKNEINKVFANVDGYESIKEYIKDKIHEYYKGLGTIKGKNPIVLLDEFEREKEEKVCSNCNKDYLYKYSTTKADAHNLFEWKGKYYCLPCLKKVNKFWKLAIGKGLNLTKALEHAKPAKQKGKSVCLECKKTFATNKFHNHYRIHLYNE